MLLNLLLKLLIVEAVESVISIAEAVDCQYSLLRLRVGSSQ